MVRRPYRKRLFRRVALAAALVASVVAAQSSAALASSTLASAILTKALPGFVVTSPGPDNGPLNGSNVNSLFASDTAAQRAAITQQLADGNLSGYIRVWHSRVAGDGLVENAYQTPTVYSISTFLGGFEKGAQARVVALGGSTFAVPGIPDAKGYDTYVADNNPPFREFVVAFAKGTSAFMVTLVTAHDDLTEAQAITLAQRQWAKAPGTAVAPEVPPSVLVDLLSGLGAALLVAVAGAVWLTIRRRRLANGDEGIHVPYRTYRGLARGQRKVARKMMVKSRLNQDDQLNLAAIAWADHNVNIYWVTLAAFIALSATVAIVSQGHVFVVSLFAIAALVGVIRLRSKRAQFIEARSRQPKVVEEPLAGVVE